MGSTNWPGSTITPRTTAGRTHARSLRGELAQHFLTGGRKLCRVGRKALHDPAAARRNAAANRTDIGAAGRPQHEQFFTGPHRPQYHDRGRRGRRRRRSRCGGSRACCGRTAAGSADGRCAGRRKFCLVLFQALQGRGAAGRHAGADFWIIGAAGAADRGNLRAGGLFRRRASSSSCLYAIFLYFP